MSTYIATFPAGCFEIISRKLKEFTMSELKIVNHDESSVTFTTSLLREQLIDIRYFTNLFLILNVDRLVSYRKMIKSDGYRIYALTRGNPVEIDPAVRAQIARNIEESLQLRAHTARYSNDFVLLARGSEEPVLTLRLPRAKHKREQSPPGALRPELANILLILAGVRPKDTLLDPFAGYGSIPVEAMRGFGLKNVIAVEKNLDVADRIVKEGIQTHIADASNLHMLNHESVDKVVTDPPWGIYEEQSDADLKTLYEKSLAEIHRVLKPQGIAVILSGNETLSRILESTPDFSVIKSFPILVSGKKATLFKLQKST